MTHSHYSCAVCSGVALEFVHFFFLFFYTWLLFVFFMVKLTDEKLWPSDSPARCKFKIFYLVFFFLKFRFLFYLKSNWKVTSVFLKSVLFAFLFFLKELSSCFFFSIIILIFFFKLPCFCFFFYNPDFENDFLENLLSLFFIIFLN